MTLRRASKLAPINRPMSGSDVDNPSPRGFKPREHVMHKGYPDPNKLNVPWAVSGDTPRDPTTPHLPVSPGKVRHPAASAPKARYLQTIAKSKK